MTESPWWEPQLADAAYIARLRADFPDICELRPDEWILERFNRGRAYVAGWANTDEAYKQFEELAEAYYTLKAAQTRPAINWEREVTAILEGLGERAVRVTEGGGPENLALSLAVSVAKLARS